MLTKKLKVGIAFTILIVLYIIWSEYTKIYYFSPVYLILGAILVFKQIFPSTKNQDQENKHLKIPVLNSFTNIFKYPLWLGIACCFLGPFLLAWVGSWFSSTSMYNENGSGVFLWFYFFTIPIGVVLVIIAIIMAVIKQFNK